MEYFTRERLNNKFKSDFDLTNYAIKIARLHIQEQDSKSLTQIIKELEGLPELEKDYK
jgi:hypothetical protein